MIRERVSTSGVAGVGAGPGACRSRAVSMPSASAALRSGGPTRTRCERGRRMGEREVEDGKERKRLRVVGDFRGAEHAGRDRHQERLEDRAGQDVRRGPGQALPDTVDRRGEVLDAAPLVPEDREEGKDVRPERDGDGLAGATRRVVAPRSASRISFSFRAARRKNSAAARRSGSELGSTTRSGSAPTRSKRALDEGLAVGDPGRVTAGERFQNLLCLRSPGVGAKGLEDLAHLLRSGMPPTGRRLARSAPSRTMTSGPSFPGRAVRAISSRS